MKRNEKKLAARRTIVAAALKKFKEDGFDGTGVDGLMKEAGLTSGAFYTQFDSKNEVFAEALRTGFGAIIADVRGRIAKDGSDWYRKRCEHYLSIKHRTNVGIGCLLPNVSVDAARADKGVRQEFETGLGALVEEFSGGLEDSDDAEARERAIAAIALMAGGIMLARAVNSDKSAGEILNACRKCMP